MNEIDDLIDQRTGGSIQESILGCLFAGDYSSFAEQRLRMQRIYDQYQLNEETQGGQNSWVSKSDTLTECPMTAEQDDPTEHEHHDEHYQSASQGFAAEPFGTVITTPTNQSSIASASVPPPWRRSTSSWTATGTQQRQGSQWSGPGYRPWQRFDQEWFEKYHHPTRTQNREQEREGPSRTTNQSYQGPPGTTIETWRPPPFWSPGR